MNASGTGSPSVARNRLKTTLFDTREMIMPTHENNVLRDITRLTQGKDAFGILNAVYSLVSNDRIVLASSLSIEDQVITHMLCSLTKPRIFTLDTGRLFHETYETMEETMKHYNFRYEIYAPDSHELEEMIAIHGPNLFYQSMEFRKKCCAVRKTHPLRRVLSSADVWICGLRRDQAFTRADVNPVEWDESNSIIKVNPLFDWSEERTRQFISENNIPYNPLQNNGYRSIGCAPCTRPIKPEDDIRSGRWWWEEPEHKECGLHERRRG